MAMTLRLPEQLDEQVKKQARAEGISAQTLLERAAQEYLARHVMNKEIDEGMAEIKAVFGDALRRLGE